MTFCVPASTDRATVRVNSHRAMVKFTNHRNGSPAQSYVIEPARSQTSDSALLDMHPDLVVSQIIDTDENYVNQIAEPYINNENNYVNQIDEANYQRISDFSIYPESQSNLDNDQQHSDIHSPPSYENALNMPIPIPPSVKQIHEHPVYENV